MKRISTLLLLAIAGIVILSVLGQYMFKRNDSHDISLYYLKINQKLPLSNLDKQVYLIPISQNKINISFRAQNANKAYIYEGNNLIKRINMLEQDLQIDIEIQPNTKELKVVFENKNNKLEKTIALFRTSLTTSDNEEVMYFIPSNDFNIFLVGTIDLQLPISKYKNLYIYKESINNHSSEKLQLPSNIISGRGTLHSVEKYILVDLPVDKLYDTILHRGFILQSDSNKLDILWDSEHDNPNIKLTHKKDDLDITVNSKSAVIAYSTLAKKLPEGSSGNKNRYDIKGISGFSLQEHGEVYLKVYYPLYNLDVAPVLDLGHLIINYKMNSNGLEFHTINFQM